MGLPYSAIVGDMSLWPSRFSYAIKSVRDTLVAHRCNSVSVKRPITRLVRQDSAGSSSGGGGDGLTTATAYLCRNMADVRALAASVLTANMALLFCNGSTFYAANSNTNQGIQATSFGNYTLGSYFDPARPSDQKPRLLGCKPVTASGLTSDNINYSYSDSTQWYWVRGRTAGSDPIRGWRRIGYDKASSSANVASNDRSWWWETSTGTVRVGTGGDVDDATQLEAAVATGAGISVNDFDGIRIDSLILEMWGMNDPVNGGSCIYGTLSGTNECLISNCELGFSTYHSGVFFTSNIPGGILTVDRCSLGYFICRSNAESGGGDSCVMYNSAGGQEFILNEATWWGGALRRIGLAGADGTNLGNACYAHAGTLTWIGLYIRNKCQMHLPANVRVRWSDVSGAGDAVVAFSTGGVVSKASVVAPGMDQRQFRFWTFDESMNDEVASNMMIASTMTGVHINSKRTLKVSPAAGPRYLFGVAANYFDSAEVNCITQVAMSGAWSGKYLITSEHNAGTVDRDWVHGEFRVIADSGLISSPPNDFFQWDPNVARLDNFAMRNCIFSQNMVASPSVTFNLRKVSAAYASGGMSRCAFFGARATDIDGTGTRSITLSSAQTYEIDARSRNRIPSALIGAADPLQFGQVLEYDCTWARRPANPTIGPLEARPVMAAVGVGGAAVLVSERVRH